MDKRKLVEALMQKLSEDLTSLKESVKATIDAATNEESKAENQYDTRGLEASYLARGQSKRIGELEEVLLMLKHLNLKSFAPTDGISATAFVEVDLNKKRSHLFVLAKGGGLSIQHEGKLVHVVTPSSPLGEALLEQKAGNFVTLENGNDFKEYEIISVK